jgi:hypothetical protein
MNHPRTAIRNALVDRLKTKVDDAFLTDAEDRIYGSRSKPLFDQFLPAILIYARNESILEERFTTDGHGATKRELDLAIEAVVLGNEEIDNALDNIAAQIELAFDGWEMPNRKSNIMKLKSTEIDISIDGSKIYGAVKLNYTITYHTSSNNSAENL